jgi:hypothetical protein
MSKFLEIFPIAHAQNISAIAQPTWGVISSSPQSNQNSSITLSSNSNNTTVGATFKVSIEIKTNNNQINEYRLFIKFDSSKLKVIDQDPSTPGTQIKLLDQLFTIQNPSVDNIVSNDEIKLVAKTPSGSAFQVNRVVAEIEFQSQATGSTTIDILQGSGKTSLIRANGTTLNFSKNSQIITVTSQQQNNFQNNNQNNNQNNTNNNTNNTNVIPPPANIPNTSVDGGMLTYTFILIGVTLIFIGLKLNKEGK